MPDGPARAPQVFMLPADTVLDGESLARVLRMGHSRVPVHQPGDRTNLLGVVLVKELVLLDPDDRVPSPGPCQHPRPAPTVFGRLRHCCHNA